MTSSASAGSSLFDSARHEPLSGAAWDAQRAQDTIEAIVDDALRARLQDGTWPVHPDDGEAGPGLTPLYYGAAGVWWALAQLHRRVGTPWPGLDDATLDTLVAANRAWIARNPADSPRSWLMGEAGLQALATMLAPTPALDDALAASVAANLENPTRELMWGAPGSMRIALERHEATGDARWQALFRAGAARLEAALEASAEHRCRYWTQDMYGWHTSYLGAVHGFAGNAAVLLRGQALLEPAQADAWRDVIATTLARSALVDGALANWPAWLLPVNEKPGAMLVQFCHGAPGFVIAVADGAPPTLDALLLAAGETTWVAGPLVKGSNLCHGSAGNGYAFLKLHARTGDARWLDRARAFAMHAIGQYDAACARHGGGRYSLWTGDLGLALYLVDCIAGTASFPLLDRAA